MQTVELALPDSILESLSPAFKTVIAAYAVETEMPPAYVIELAIVFFLDPDAMTFEDCRVGVMREPLARLKAYHGTRQGISGLVEHLPLSIRATLTAYAAETGLSPETVIEFALVNFLVPGITTFEQFQANLAKGLYAA